MSAVVTETRTPTLREGAFGHARAPRVPQTA